MGLERDIKQAGDSIVDAVRQLTEQLSDMKLAYRDHQTQLLITNQSMLAVRTELLGRMDTLEVKVLEQFAAVQAQLQAIARVLGTNGSGGHHA